MDNQGNLYTRDGFLYMSAAALAELTDEERREVLRQWREDRVEA